MILKSPGVKYEIVSYISGDSYGLISTRNAASLQPCIGYGRMGRMILQGLSIGDGGSYCRMIGQGLWSGMGSM